MITNARFLWIPILLSVAIIPTGCRTASQPSEGSSTSIADAQLDDKSVDGKLVDGKRILEQGQSQGQMPIGLKVRIGACMGEADEGTPDASRELVERWEFTPGECHRIECRFENGNAIYNRLESRKFETSNICRDLIEGRAFEIQARQGTGPEIVLAGTIYHRGTRSLEVLWNDQTVLELDETNGPTLVTFKQTDAEAFGKLYERFATQARGTFNEDAVR